MGISHKIVIIIMKVVTIGDWYGHNCPALQGTSTITAIMKKSPKKLSHENWSRVSMYGDKSLY